MAVAAVAAAGVAVEVEEEAVAEAVEQRRSFKTVSSGQWKSIHESHLGAKQIPRHALRAPATAGAAKSTPAQRSPRRVRRNPRGHAKRGCRSKIHAWRRSRRASQHVWIAKIRGCVAPLPLVRPAPMRRWPIFWKVARRPVAQARR